MIEIFIEKSCNDFVPFLFDPAPNMLQLTCIFVDVEVWSTVFYMGRFSGPSPKRHKVWSNDKSLLDAIFERGGYMSRVDQQACSTKLVKSYMDSKGVKRVVGLKDQLRSSQQPVANP